MKKKICVCAAVVAAVTGILCGCTPKSVSLWCECLGEQFSFEYSAYDVTYDGTSRKFSVKDSEDFEEYLQSLEQYEGMSVTADTGSDAFVFLQEGVKFACVKDGDGYSLSGCLLEFSHIELTCVFAYPPMTDTYVLEENMAQTETEQTWDYFKEFYEDVADASVDDEAKQVTVTIWLKSHDASLGTALVTYEDGTVSRTLEWDEEE